MESTGITLPSCRLWLPESGPLQDVAAPMSPLLACLGAITQIIQREVLAVGHDPSTSWFPALVSSGSKFTWSQSQSIRVWGRRGTTTSAMLQGSTACRYSALLPPRICGSSGSIKEVPRGHLIGHRRHCTLPLTSNSTKARQQPNNKFFRICLPTSGLLARH